MLLGDIARIQSATSRPDLLKQLDSGLLSADCLPLGCAVKVGGEWVGFEGMADGAMVLSSGSAGFTYTPSDGETFVWSSPF
jgi:hypothetical protein